MKVTIWNGCYDSGWAGVISADSFAHPAKMARGLLDRILNHGFDAGWWTEGDLIGDCFGGVGSTGVLGAYCGLRVVSVELEPRFYAIAGGGWGCPGNKALGKWTKDASADWPVCVSCRELWKKGDVTEHHHAFGNYEVHCRKWGERFPHPMIIQGDSRQFDRIIGEHLAAVVASPPYSDISAGQGGLNTKPAKHPGQQSGRTESLASQNADQRYGQSDGQISRLKPGTVDSVITSPPFTQGYQSGGGINVKGYGVDGADKVGSRTYQGTGGERTPGNIENLPSGKLDACITSPPWEKNSEGGRGGHKFKDATATLSSKRGHGASDAAVLAQAERDKQKTYGDSPGQIGQEQKETYWQAVRDVYSAVWRSLKPDGILVLVVKDFVKKGQRVPLCDDTVRLCESLGFTCIERIHAMLTSETKHADLFGGETVKTKSRKSFFRRLAEKKGSPAIDFEEVLVFKKLRT